MKLLYYSIFLLFFGSISAQNPCEYVSNVTDSLGVYKETSEYLMHERNFGASTSLVYFSLAQNDGMPILNVQFINKSKDFIKVRCLDKNSRLFIQLDNGKIVTLLHIDQENCGTNLRDKGVNNRVMNGVFMFLKGSIEDLKKSPVSTIRVRYATESEDIIIRSELLSETSGEKYTPNTYFMTTLKCIE